MRFPEPDKDNIVSLLPGELSAANEENRKHFTLFAPCYDLLMRYIVRPWIQRAHPLRHQVIWRELIGSVHGCKILDLACGTGGLISSIPEDNEYTGLDLSHAMLKKAAVRAERKGFTAYRLILGNAEEQLFPTAGFELVVTDTALHLIPDWQGAVARAAESLVPGGGLLGAVPILGIDKSFDGMWSRLARRFRFHALRQDDLQQACDVNMLDFTPVKSNGGVFYFRAVKR